MKKITYNKLVRDKIPDIIAANGDKAKLKTLSAEEIIDHLNAKLSEEVQEFLDAKAPSAKLSEAADVIIVLKTMAEMYGILWKDIETFNRGDGPLYEPIEQNLKRAVQNITSINDEWSLIRNMSKIMTALQSGLPSIAKKVLKEEIAANLAQKGGFKKGYFLISTTRS